MRSEISRRKFLNLTAACLLSLSFRPGRNIFRRAEQTPDDYFETGEPLGRVSANAVNLYKEPSTAKGYLKTISHNTLLPITNIVVAASENSYNRIWYELGEDGYAHSGFIQPVQVKLNSPLDNIPPKGLLAEVTVPFTKGLLSPSWPDAVVYNLYYGSTYWVSRVIPDAKGNLWYRVLDEAANLVESSQFGIVRQRSAGGKRQDSLVQAVAEAGHDIVVPPTMHFDLPVDVKYILGGESRGRAREMVVIRLKGPFRFTVHLVGPSHKRVGPAKVLTDVRLAGQLG